MKPRAAPSFWGIGIAFFLSAPAGIASGQTPSLPSFFDALASELDARDVSAVDGASVARVLGSGLGWTVAEGDIKATLGARYRLGQLFRFLACEAGHPCVLATAGSHVKLVSASSGEESPNVELRFDLSSTDEDKSGVFLRFLHVSLAPSDGAWRVVASSIQGKMLN